MTEFHGRLVDCDSHLYLTPAQLPDAVGPDFARRFIRLQETTFGPRDVAGEAARVTMDVDSVWRVKGWQAGAAYDAGLRVQTLNLMGVDRQVLFPDGLFASVTTSRMPGAPEAASRYNDYVLDWSAAGNGRLRPMAILHMRDVAAAISEAERTISRGAYGFYLSCAAPPAGMAPANPAWDRLWALLAEARVPAFLHVGSESGFLDKAWGAIPGPGGAPELGPFSLATNQIGPQVYLTALILGGVFERHPGLRMGITEFTAQWVGPLAEMLDQRVAACGHEMSRFLSLKPSEYLSRQLRVTPFYWEPVDTYIDRYGLADVYAFSTDFPHTEGGEDPVDQFRGRIGRLGADVSQKFFVGNGALLCPDR
jgi:predicted TIM-barrel fold metal-dependent hydrolase